MGSRAINLRLGQPGDAAEIALMSRDLIEVGLRWRWRPERVQEALLSRQHLAVIARDPRARSHLLGFGIMELRAADEPAVTIDWRTSSSSLAGSGAVAASATRAASRRAGGFGFRR